MIAKPMGLGYMSVEISPLAVASGGRGGQNTTTAL